MIVQGVSWEKESAWKWGWEKRQWGKRVWHWGAGFRWLIWILVFWLLEFGTFITYIPHSFVLVLVFILWMQRGYLGLPLSSSDYLKDVDSTTTVTSSTPTLQLLCLLSIVLIFFSYLITNISIVFFIIKIITSIKRVAIKKLSDKLDKIWIIKLK